MTPLTTQLTQRAIYTPTAVNATKQRHAQQQQQPQQQLQARRQHRTRTRCRRGVVVQCSSSEGASSKQLGQRAAAALQGLNVYLLCEDPQQLPVFSSLAAQVAARLE